ncbi:hypothetical protein DRE_07474 [Drechslerella stenobrocha 248]|uniref:JmjC domain-containing protein n=1 Tax=Drechslerella stenobrocha 248 TaxID=1043628 RepID=W7HUI3_9PEZI|nr:hypothetical protein DRE_07474 [Drechslerella stenobrocha 248]
MSLLRRLPRYLSPSSHPPKPFDVYSPNDPSSFALRRHNTPLADAKPTIFTNDLFLPHIPAFQTLFLPNSSNLDLTRWRNILAGDETPISVEQTFGDGSGITRTSCTWNDVLGYISGPSTPHAPLYIAQQPPPPRLAEELPPPFTHLGFTIRPAQRQSLDTTTTTTNDDEREHERPQIDIYSSSLWLARAEHRTNTTLHRDPNDNLFVQLAGTKIVRCMPPELGDALFSALAAAGRVRSADGRGRIRDNLLDVNEMAALDAVTWGDEDENGGTGTTGAAMPGSGDGDVGLVAEIARAARAETYEAVVKRGEGMYIPRGWWHAVRSVPPPLEMLRQHYEKHDRLEGGVPATVSMNWWFR